MPNVLPKWRIDAMSIRSVCYTQKYWLFFIPLLTYAATMREAGHYASLRYALRPPAINLALEYPILLRVSADSAPRLTALQ